MRTLRTSAAREWVLRQPGGQDSLLRLEPGEIVTVGRDLACEIPILDAGVSRHHASFSLEGDNLWLEDLHSQNGTFVNTERITRTPLHSGDIITLGRISLTVTARALKAEEADPLRRLSQEDLARLVRMSRELGSQRGKATIFQQLLELAEDALKADRGIVFLWEEARSQLHPVAASPHELFQAAGHIVSGSLASAVISSRRARILGDVADPGSSSALLVPLYAGEKAIGVLYLDRGPARRAFQASDADFVNALAWVTSLPLSAFTRLSDSRDSNEKLESIVTERTRELARLRLRTSPTQAFEQAGIEWLAELQRALTGARTEIERADEATIADIQKSSVRALHLARLCTESVAHLAEWHPERLQAVELTRIISEVSGLDKDRRAYELEAGAELSLFCNPEEILVVLRLLTESALGADAPRVRVSATAEGEGALVRLRIVRAPAAAESPEQSPGGQLERLAERLAEKIVTERLKGELDVAPDGSWIELRVPQPAVSLGETIMLPTHG